MFQSVRQTGQQDSGAAVDIAPLIDIVFILLIFFLVTATFVRDTGVKVERAQASLARTLKPSALRVSIAASGRLYAEGKVISRASLHTLVQQHQTKHASGSVIVIPDKSVPSGLLIEVMDLARQAGAKDVAVATERSR